MTTSTEMTPYSYPTYEKLQGCTVVIKDPVSGEEHQIAIDDLYEAIKYQLSAEGFRKGYF